MLFGVSDARVGAAIRSVRLRRGWRQSDVAARAKVSRALVSLLERGHVERVALGTLRSVGQALDIQIDVTARWRGGELARLLNADHAALHESVALFFGEMAGWEFAPEVTFNIYGERGVIDLLAWHAATRTLLIVELKTLLVDIHDVMAANDRRRRLAGAIAAQYDWHPRIVGVWVVLANTRTNRRRIAAHATVLRAAFPAGGADIHAWLRAPVAGISALSLWSYANRGGASPGLAGRQRVRVRRKPQSVASATPIDV
jgi:transcriptional regulator with XRE-family HTH domain